MNKPSIFGSCSKSNERIGSEEDSSIPEWIKTNAGWWADGQIDDKTFATGIEFLIKIGLIVV